MDEQEQKDEFLELTSENVEKLIRSCLYTEEELADLKRAGWDGKVPPEGSVVVGGLTTTFAFHPQKIEEAKEKVRQLLLQLDPNFRASVGGGWSFLQLCMRPDGMVWGEHRSCEALLVLAIATKYGSYCSPRETWSQFPGGVPYVMFDV